MTTTYAAFDAADYLDNDAVIAEYLSAAIEDPNQDVFLAALGDVARAGALPKATHEPVYCRNRTRTNSRPQDAPWLETYRSLR